MYKNLENFFLQWVKIRKKGPTICGSLTLIVLKVKINRVFWKNFRTELFQKGPTKGKKLKKHRV